MGCELSSIPQQSPRLWEPKGTVIRRRIGNFPPPASPPLLPFGSCKIGSFSELQFLLYFP